jgi:hypothetical protein
LVKPDTFFLNTFLLRSFNRHQSLEWTARPAHSALQIFTTLLELAESKIAGSELLLIHSSRTS